MVSGKSAVGYISVEMREKGREVSSLIGKGAWAGVVPCEVVVHVFAHWASVVVMVCAGGSGKNEVASD